MKKIPGRIIPIDHVESSERCALVPGYHNRKPVRRLKEVSRKKGNCYFAHGVPMRLADFIYRSTIKLDLKERELIFSRGAVKKNGVAVLNAVAVRELDWDCGTSIRIPKMLRYDDTIRLTVNGKNYSLRLMELIVLGALMRISLPGRRASWYADMSATVLAEGWPHFDMNKSPEVSKKK